MGGSLAKNSAHPSLQTGMRLVKRLSMATSRFTLVRIIRQTSQEKVARLTEVSSEPSAVANPLPSGASPLTATEAQRQCIYAWTERRVCPGYARLLSPRAIPRSDIYSIGALLHFFLSGKDPSVQKTRFYFALLKLQKFLPMYQSTITMLERDPLRRPGSINEVAWELQRTSAGLRSYNLKCV
jgi:hypothetical protein